MTIDFALDGWAFWCALILIVLAWSLWKPLCAALGRWWLEAQAGLLYTRPDRVRQDCCTDDYCTLAPPGSWCRAPGFAKPRI